MKIDIYTKSILTVIAAALVWICIREAALSPARATEESEVRIVFYGENRRSVIARPIQRICLSHTTTFRHPTELSTGEM